MRHTRKMVLIPEAEYQMMMNSLMKGGDALQNEKLRMDAKIADILADPIINPELKAKKYSWLYKQRRQLKDLIENKPQKVIIQNQTEQPPNIAPYMGISKIPEKIEPAADDDNKALIRKSLLRKPKVKPLRIAKQSTSTTEGSTSNGTENSGQSSKSIAESESTQYSSAFENPAEAKMTQKQFMILSNYVNDHKAKFGIHPDGRILSYRNLPIKDSNFQLSLDYMAGKIDSPPRGHKFFENALRRDEGIRSMFFQPQKSSTSEQEGEGPRLKKHKRRFAIVKFAQKKTIIKTPGIERHQPIFKPQLWARI